MQSNGTERRVDVIAVTEMLTETSTNVTVASEHNSLDTRRI